MTPSLVTIARRALAGECALAQGTKVLVAVSGGPDSMALLSALVRLAPRFELSVLAHGVDHGLRPEAAAELDLAEAFARAHEVRFDRSVVRVARGGNLQARAREARWAALIGAARTHGATIATAHHAEDRAETLLMRVLRGAGARGLAVLPPRSLAAGAPDIEIVRPIVRALRSDVVTHLERHGVPFAEDPSNADPRYLRTRVRKDVLPLLRGLDPAVVSHLAAIADDLAAPRGASSRDARWTSGLPRPTQAAIAALIQSRSSEARVWLPDGLALMVQPKRDSGGTK